MFAQELEIIVSTTFDVETIVKGYTLESSDGLMRLGIRPDILNVSTRVDIKTLDSSIMEDTLESFLPPTTYGSTVPSSPSKDDLKPSLLGNIYLFDILNKESYDISDFFFLEIKYPEAEQNLETLHGRRRIYYYNGVKSQWEELPSSDNPETQSVRALIHLPYARLAIFEDDEIPEVGEASWYGYKGCDCAASPDYPKGSYLVVTRIDDPTKSVTVKVNDWADRASIRSILRISRVCELVSLGAGLIDVRVTYLQ